MQLLHLEDEGPLCDMLKLALLTLEPGLEVKQFLNSNDALTYIESAVNTVDLFILDIRVPGKLDGLAFARHIRDMGSPVPIILTSAYGKPSQNIITMLNCEWIPKPWYLMKLTQQILPMIRESHQRRDNKPEPTLAAAVPATEDKTIARNPIPGGRTREITPDMIRRALRDDTPAPEPNDPLGKNRELILVIKGLIEHRVITDDFSIILGRSDQAKNYMPDVDLSIYATPDSGISRMHARLHADGEHLYVTDLTSTNGTYLDGKRLAPNNPTPIYKGDELILGQLPIKVLFR